MTTPVDKTIQFIQNNIHLLYKVDELADVACLSPVQLHRVFKKHTGVTPIQFGEQMKIKYAIELLQQKIGVQEIAFQLGYVNYETFTRSFKKICSIAPSELQQLLQIFQEVSNSEQAMLVKMNATQSDVIQLWNESINTKDFHPDNNEIEIYKIQVNSKNSSSRKVNQKFDLVRDKQLIDSLKRYINSI